MLRLLTSLLVISWMGTSFLQGQSSNEVSETNTKAVLIEAAQTWERAKATHNYSLQAKSAFSICQQFLSSENYLNTITFCKDAIVYYEEQLVYDTLAVLFENTGILLDLTGDLDASLKAFEKGLEYAQQADDPLIKGSILNDIGVLYAHQDDDSKALELYYQARKIFEDAKHFTGLKKVYVSIGRTFDKQLNYDQAISFYDLALTNAEIDGDKIWAAIALNYLGNIHLNKNEWNLAKAKFESVISLAEQTNNLYSKATARMNLAKVDIHFGNIDEANNNLKEALQLLETTQKEQNKNEVYNLLAEIAIQNKAFGTAEEMLESAEELGLVYKSKRALSRTYSLLGKLYAQQKEFEKSILAYQKSEMLKDSLFQSEKANWAIQSEASYELGRKDAEIKSLEELADTKETYLQQQKSLNYALLAIAILAIILAVVLILNAQKAQQQKSELESMVKERTLDLLNTTNKLKESYYELERFAFIASHDFKEPIRNIGTFIGLINQRLNGQKDQELQDYLNYCLESAKRLHNLMEDAASFLSMKEHTMAKQKIELSPLVLNIWGKLEIDKANLEICKNLSEIKGYEQDIEILFRQLIENGLKYNKSEKPQISIHQESKNNHRVIAIKDNGIGIEERHLEKVMGMFTRAFHEYEGKGSGLGLAICKKIMDLHNGKIWLDSEVGKGTTVYLRFPN